MAMNDGIRADSSEELSTLEELRRRERELADFIENASVGLHWVGADGTILWANQAELDLLGYTREEYIGRKIWEFHEDSDVINDILRRLTNKETLRDYEARLKCRDGSIRHVLINSNVMWEEDRFVHTRCFTRDITERKQAEALVEGQRQALELIVQDAPLSEVLETLARVVEGQSNAEGLVSILLIDDDGLRLRHGAAPSLPEAYSRAIDGAPVAPEGGSCVAAAFRKEPVISTDIATDPVWAPYRDLALSHGLRACWSTPIISSSSDVLGTFAIYYREPRAPSPHDLRLIQLMTRTAAIAIERKRSDEARREGEEQNHLLFENSRDALLIADDNGKYLRANGAAAELLGYTREQLLKMSVSDLITTDSTDATARYQIYLNSGYEVGEFSFVRPDGERRTAEYVANRLAPGMHLSALRDVTETKRAEAERERLLSNEQAARTAAEEALRLQRHIEERLVLLLEASKVLLGSPTLEAVQPAVLDLSQRLIAADAYAIWRVDHTTGVWSPVAQAGMSPSYTKQSISWAGNTDALLKSPFIAEDVMKISSLAARHELYYAEGIKSLLAVPLHIHGVISGTLTFYYRQPHSFAETEVRVATTLANLAGAAISSAELYEEQRRMRSEAEDAERRAHYLAEATSALSSSLDYQRTLAQVAQLFVPDLADWCAVDMAAEGGTGLVRLAVAHADPAKVEWANELASRYPVDMNAPNGVPNVLRTGKSELYSRISDEMLVAAAMDDEHLQLMRDIGFTSAMVVPLSVQGEVLGAITFVTAESGRHYGPSDLAFAEDLARRAAAAIDNARLYRSAQEARRIAEESNRLKDEFLATVSHELRTPLTAMLGWTYLLRAGGLDEQSAVRALETVERNARSQAQLIEDLLDVSRIITGKLRLDVRTVDPASFIDSAIESVRPAAEAKEIRLQKVIDTGVSAISGDSERLQQVVWNLLSNAIKFTPKGGRVQVRLERINSHIEIAVTDTGSGIKSEFLPYVFDRFRQADGTYTRQHGGLGLGLSIVRHLVELHGGSVEAFSPGEGQGATFAVKLPLMPVYQGDPKAERVHPTARETRPAVECPDSIDGLKVLVVDDEVDTLELIKISLMQCGAEVTTAQSVAGALAVMSGALPDVIISDIGMPGEDGFDLIRKVRQLPPELGGKIPAVALTAYARAEDRLRVLRSGYQMHVAKPVELAELVAIVANLVGRSN